VKAEICRDVGVVVRQMGALLVVDPTSKMTAAKVQKRNVENR
jgi:hypothetical protein